MLNGNFDSSNIHQNKFLELHRKNSKETYYHSMFLNTLPHSDIMTLNFV
jgi:hypothetical protein